LVESHEVRCRGVDGRGQQCRRHDRGRSCDA
jgi:hypothetical protein